MRTFSYPQISVQIPGVSTEATLLLIAGSVDSIDNKVSTEAKQDVQITAADDTNTKLDTLIAKDYATAANQVTAQASLSSIDTKLTSPLAVTTGGLTDTELRASAVPVSLASVPLASGAATSANQVTAQTSLSSIDSKLTSPLAVTTGGLTDTELRATPVPISGSVTTSGTSTVSGTVTANAGTNLNTSLLALDSTVAKDSSLATIDTSINSLLKPASTLAAVTTVGAVTSITNALPAGNNIIGQIKLSGKTIANSPVRNDYTVTAVTTGAYTQLVASTTTATTEIEIFDSSGQTLFLAIGAAASEVNQILIFPGGNGRIPLVIPAGTRISIKAVSGNASVGEIDINFYN